MNNVPSGVTMPSGRLAGSAPVTLQQQEDDARQSDSESDLCDVLLQPEYDNDSHSMALLKHKLMNQRVQLSHYLRKALVSDPVFEFSKSCVPNRAGVNEDTRLALATFKVPRDVTSKSRLLRLYERLRDQESRVNTLLHQISLDPSGASRLECELVKHRTLADRLLAVEQERNELVERVFANPHGETVSSHCPPPEPVTIDAATNTHVALPDENQRSLIQVLQRVQSEVTALLTLVVEQRCAFSKELRAAWAENERLREETAIGDSSALVVLRTKCDIIERHMEEVRRAETERESEVERLAADLELSESRAMELETQVRHLRARLQNSETTTMLLDELMLQKQQDEPQNLLTLDTEKPREEHSNSQSYSRVDAQNDSSVDVGTDMDSEPTSQSHVSTNSASLRVESRDANGKSESLRAVLESSAGLSGLVEAGSPTNLKLRMEYVSQDSGRQPMRSSRLRTLCRQLFGVSSDVESPPASEQS